MNINDCRNALLLCDLCVKLSGLCVKTEVNAESAEFYAEHAEENDCQRLGSSFCELCGFAFRLYQKLGFQATGADEMYFSMKWRKNMN